MSALRGHGEMGWAAETLGSQSQGLEEADRFPHPMVAPTSLPDGIVMALIAVAAGFCSLTVWTQIWAMLSFNFHENQ